MEHIVPAQHLRHVFVQLVESPIDYFMHRGDVSCHCLSPTHWEGTVNTSYCYMYFCPPKVVFQSSQKQLSRSDFVTIVPLLKIIRQMDKLLPEYGQLLSVSL